MALKLYMIDRSPPARAVLMTAKALGINLEQINIDFSKNEHLSPEYLKHYERSVNNSSTYTYTHYTAAVLKMAPKLYMIETSPPVRSVLMTAKAIGLTLELIPVDILKGEQLSDEYLKLNPQHTVPTLDDNGFIIWDSHAINIYLVTKYGKGDSLYPKDPQKQAIINQRLHFDSGVLFPSILSIIRPILRQGVKIVPPEKAAVVTDAYAFLEKFLHGHHWAAGDSVTVSDLNLIACITSIAILVPVDEGKFPNVTAWIKRVQALPCYDANKNGIEKLTNLLQGLLQS